MNRLITVDLEVQVDAFEELPAKLAALATVGVVRGFNYFERADHPDPAPEFAAAPAEAPAPKVGKGKKKDDAAAAPAPAPAPAAAPAEAPAPAPAGTGTPANPDAVSPKMLVDLRAAAARVIGANAKFRAEVHALVAAASPNVEQPALSKVPAAAAEKLLADINALHPETAQ